MTNSVQWSPNAIKTNTWQKSTSRQNWVRNSFNSNSHGNCKLGDYISLNRWHISFGFGLRITPTCVKTGFEIHFSKCTLHLNMFSSLDFWNNQKTTKNLLINIIADWQTIWQSHLVMLCLECFRFDTHECAVAAADDDDAKKNKLDTFSLRFVHVCVWNKLKLIPPTLTTYKRFECSIYSRLQIDSYQKCWQFYFWIISKCCFFCVCCCYFQFCSNLVVTWNFCG